MYFSVIKVGFTHKNKQNRTIRLQLSEIYLTTSCTILVEKEVERVTRVSQSQHVKVVIVSKNDFRPKSFPLIGLCLLRRDSPRRIILTTKSNRTFSGVGQGLLFVDLWPRRVLVLVRYGGRARQDIRWVSNEGHFSSDGPLVVRWSGTKSFYKGIVRGLVDLQEVTRTHF